MPKILFSFWQEIDQEGGLARLNLSPRQKEDRSLKLLSFIKTSVSFAAETVFFLESTSTLGTLF